MNIGLVLAYMPETKEIKKKSEKFSNDQSNVLSFIRDEIKGKKKQWDLGGGGDFTELERFNEQIEQMQNMFNEREAGMEQALIQLENELYQPVYKKISGQEKKINLCAVYSVQNPL